MKSSATLLQKEPGTFPVMLAPMVGLSHVALRGLVRHYMPAGTETLWPTEMLSSWRLPNENLGQTPETLKVSDDERFLVPQILGNEEKPIAESVQRLIDWGASAIDINMGCPVKKALRHNYGVALMGDPEYAAEVVHMTVKNSTVPVSVKLRAGLQSDVEFLKRFTRGLEQAGASWLTLHPRVAGEQRRGRADWSQIRLVREHLNIPVVGNGDVQCLEDIEALFETSNCDAVMVGRALVARPWLMWQVGERLGLPAPAAHGARQAPRTPHEEGAEYGRACLFLLDELERHFDFEAGAKRFRFHLRVGAVWLEFGHALTAACARGATYDELRRTVQKFFEAPQRLFARTELRQ